MDASTRKAIIERIKTLRTRFAGSRGKSKFANALGVSASTYNYYENDRVPPADILVKICDITGADLKWLLTGQADDKNFAFASNHADTDRAHSQFLQNFGALLDQNPDLAGPISAFIELLLEKKGIEAKLNLNEPASATQVADTAESPPEKNQPGWIPVLGRTAAGVAGFWDQVISSKSGHTVTKLDDLVRKHSGKPIVNSTDAMVSIDLQTRALADSLTNPQVNLVRVDGAPEDSIVEFIQCRQIYNAFPDSFALQIDGDSMSPRINDGDIVILSPSVAAVQGQTAVVQLKNQIGVTCKLIRITEDSIHLIPINESYETKVIAKERLEWALAVLCHITL